MGRGGEWRHREAQASGEAERPGCGWSTASQGVGRVLTTRFETRSRLSFWSLAQSRVCTAPSRGSAVTCTPLSPAKDPWRAETGSGTSLSLPPTQPGRQWASGCLLDQRQAWHPGRGAAGPAASSAGLRGGPCACGVRWLASGLTGPRGSDSVFETLPRPPGLGGRPPAAPRRGGQPGTPEGRELVFPDGGGWFCQGRRPVPLQSRGGTGGLVRGLVLHRPESLGKSPRAGSPSCRERRGLA